MRIILFRYRHLLESVLSNTGPELIDTLKLFIEASKIRFYLPAINFLNTK